jgi:predicted CoA-binding protein
MYLNENLQKEYYDKIIDLKPKRVIFNPGTENQEFMEILKKEGILPIEACTLVLLRTNQF